MVLFFEQTDRDAADHPTKVSLSLQLSSKFSVHCSNSWFFGVPGGDVRGREEGKLEGIGCHLIGVGRHMLVIGDGDSLKGNRPKGVGDPMQE